MNWNNIGADGAQGLEGFTSTSPPLTLLLQLPTSSASTAAPQFNHQPKAQWYFEKRNTETKISKLGPWEGDLKGTLKWEQAISLVLWVITLTCS